MLSFNQKSTFSPTSGTFIRRKKKEIWDLYDFYFSSNVVVRRWDRWRSTPIINHRERASKKKRKKKHSPFTCSHNVRTHQNSERYMTICMPFQLTQTHRLVSKTLSLWFVVSPNLRFRLFHSHFNRSHFRGLFHIHIYTYTIHTHRTHSYRNVRILKMYKQYV